MKKLSVILFVFVFVFGLCVFPALAEDEITIKGEVLENGTLFGNDGNDYTIADTDKGQEVMDMGGKIVIIKGAVSEKQGKKEIVIESYEVTNESSGG